MTASAIADPPVYSTLGDDPDFAELLEMFVEEIPARISALERSQLAGDWESLRVLAHQLKGAAGSYGFPEVTASAAALEVAARMPGDECRVSQALQSLTALCRRLRAGAP